MKTFAAVTFAALTLAAAASAAPPRTVHMYGDSIFKGWGYGQYDHPSLLNRIDRIATVMADGKLRFNRTSEQAPSLICAAVRSGRVRRGDSIVFENAGPHFNNNTAYRKWLEGVAWCSRKHRLMLSTMFDYDPDPVSVPHSTYDEPVEGGRTVNQVTVAVARKEGAHVIDWNHAMDAARKRLEPEGVHVVHPDGIHPTVWGNILMAARLVRAHGVPVRNVNRVLDELMLRREEMVGRGFNPPFTRTDAERWARTLSSGT